MNKIEYLKENIKENNFCKCFIKNLQQEKICQPYDTFLDISIKISLEGFMKDIVLSYGCSKEILNIIEFAKTKYGLDL
jgi:hypothetical protein